MQYHVTAQRNEGGASSYFSSSTQNFELAVTVTTVL